MAAHKRVKARCTDADATHTRVVLTTGQDDTCEEEATARPTIKVTSRKTGAGASGNSGKGARCTGLMLLHTPGSC